MMQAEEGVMASSEGDYAEGIVATVSFDVTFFHCAAGSFWNLTLASKEDFDFNHGDCKLCTEEMDGASEVFASAPGWGCVAVSFPRAINRG